MELPPPAHLSDRVRDFLGQRLYPTLATVGPDGQSMSGTLACDGLVIPFTAHRP